MNDSKNSLYKDILSRLAGWFGLNAEEATEAEVHQRVVEHDDTIRAMTSQIADLQEALSGARIEMAELREKVEGHARVIEEQAITISQLIEERDRLKADLDAANTALEAQIKSNQSLAAEIARMRAGAQGPSQVSVDRDDHLTHTTRPASGGIVIPAGELFKNLTRN